MNPFDDELAKVWHEAMSQHREEELGKLSAEAERWQANPAEPYLLTFSGPLEDRPHAFCPSTPIQGADCPNCQKPLMRLLSLQTSELPFWNGHGPASIHLLYCWTCAIPYDLFSYSIHADGSIEILRYLDSYGGSLGPDGPYEGFTGVFPESRVGLRALSPEEQRLALQLRSEDEYFEEYRYLTDAVHQIGGYPKIHNSQAVECPSCGKLSPFFATICDNAVGQDFQPEASLTFTQNYGVQMVFHWCAPCAVMTAYHSCD